MEKTRQKKPPKQESKKLENAAYWGAIIVSLIIIVVVIGFIVMNQNNSAEKNAFTALFFENYEKTVSGNTIDFSFTVENHEGKKTGYLAVVSVDSLQLKTIAFSLEKNQKRTERVLLPLEFDEASHKISVKLRGRPEEISYWAKAQNK